MPHCCKVGTVPENTEGGDVESGEEEERILRKRVDMLPSTSTCVWGSHEIGGAWRALVMHSFTAEMETRLRKVSTAISSVFSC